MLRNPVFRHLLAIVLGALAGASLCLSIMPLALQMAGFGDQLALSYYLKNYLVHAVLILAVGGWAVARARHPLAGGPVLGLTGLAAGIYLAFVALSREPRLLLAAGFTGALFGYLGGMILGRILVQPAAEGEGADVPGADAD